jgi:glycosyltransferase involved in cell wall biosynthesis
MNDVKDTNGGSRFDIAMPCYNAVLWLDSFIESLLSLKDYSWRLVARDDGSTDGTLDLLRRWAIDLGPKMLLIDEAAPHNLGLISNYNKVLAATTAPYILTADPDDVWLSDHVRAVIDALIDAEARYGVDKPIAVGTDAVVVNENLEHCAPSYWAWSRMVSRENPSLASIAMESAALGSTMAINRSLLNKAQPIPDGAAFQDWWLAMVAVGFGRLVLLPKATILYRRHGTNSTKEPFVVSFAEAIIRLAKEPASARKRLIFLIGQASRQAEAFLVRYREEISSSDADALCALASLTQISPFARRVAILRHRLLFSSNLKNMGLLALL